MRDDRGWAFRNGDGYSTDPVNHFAFLREAYEKTRPGFRGRWTVPVLWDKTTHRIVNLSEDDLCHQFATILGPALGCDLTGPAGLFSAHVAPAQAALSATDPRKD